MLSIQKIFIASSFLAASTSIFAQEAETKNTGWYIGGTIGSSSTNAESSTISNKKNIQHVGAYGGFILQIG
jgi:hypothetical protein